MSTPQVRMLLRDIERLEAELVEACAVIDRVRALAKRWETTPALRRGTCAADLRRTLEQP